MEAFFLLFLLLGNERLRCFSTQNDLSSTRGRVVGN
ncbi:MAG: hypothetical protein RIS47_1479 [Bacteroidota bacterium]|jgi:hypothetical protein